MHVLYVPFISNDKCDWYIDSTQVWNFQGWHEALPDNGPEEYFQILSSKLDLNFSTSRHQNGDKKYRHYEVNS
jgi:hypothetical protein